jgi:tyrosyl-tRNA synthetase
LGKTIVSQFYDEAAAENAAAEFDKVFAQNQLPDEIPEVRISAKPIMTSKLLMHCKLVSTGGEGKRMIRQSGVSVDGKKVTDPNAEITPTTGMVVQVGKRKFARLIIK